MLVHLQRRNNSLIGKMLQRTSRFFMTDAE